MRAILFCAMRSRRCRRGAVRAADAMLARLPRGSAMLMRDARWRWPAHYR
jgi:hypothetical protein